MKTKKYRGRAFESSSSKTPEFIAFAMAFKADLLAQLPEGVKLEAYHVGHFYVSGFVSRGGKYAYFSISDVRYFRDDWVSNVLIRTAESLTDYTGGRNCYTSLSDFGHNIARLLDLP